MTSTSALLFANGDAHDGDMVRRVLNTAHEPLLVAADGGARVARAFGYTPHVVIGDMDSLTAEELDTLRADGAGIQRHPPEKDETDLEIALKWTAQQGVSTIHVLGALGGRLDQMLANIYLLALPELQGLDVDLVAGRQATRLWRAGDHVLRGAPGDTVSLLPLGGSVSSVTTDGLKYPLQAEPLQFGPARGISNVLEGDEARVSFTDGVLLVIHTLGRA
jgi:thiamine pyrophosphokinase